MIESIEKFEKLIKKGKGGCIKSIIRCKNMFSIYNDLIIKKASTIEEQTRLVQSLTLTNFRYCDIKFNIVIEHKNRAIIGEIQFLIKFMLEAKIMGHSLYGMVRQREYVEDVLNTIEEENRSDPAMLIMRKDYSEFCNQLLINDAKILSIGHMSNIKHGQDHSQDPPMLYLSLKSGWNKAAKLFFDALLHFDKSHNLNKKFVKKYLSHPMLQEFKNHPLLKRAFSEQ